MGVMGPVGESEKTEEVVEGGDSNDLGGMRIGLTRAYWSEGGDEMSLPLLPLESEEEENILAGSVGRWTEALKWQDGRDEAFLPFLFILFFSSPFPRIVLEQSISFFKPKAKADAQISDPKHKQMPGRHPDIYIYFSHVHRTEPTRHHTGTGIKLMIQTPTVVPG